MDQEAAGSKPAWRPNRRGADSTDAVKQSKRLLAHLVVKVRPGGGPTHPAKNRWGRCCHFSTVGKFGRQLFVELVIVFIRKFTKLV